MSENNGEKTEKTAKKPKEKISLMDACKSGNKKKMLIAMRDIIAEKLEHCESGRDIAALSKRLAEVTDELEEIKAAEKAKREKKAAAKNPTKRDQLRALNAK